MNSCDPTPNGLRRPDGRRTCDSNARLSRFRYGPSLLAADAWDLWSAADHAEELRICVGARVGMNVAKGRRERSKAPMSPRSNAILSLAAFVGFGTVSAAAFAQAPAARPSAARPSAGHSGPAGTVDVSASAQAGSPTRATSAAVAPAGTVQAAPTPAAIPTTNLAVVQTPAPTAGPTPAAAPAPATAPAAIPPPAMAPVAVIPPGYALVPIDSAAQTRYDVEYPQHQGALPPGMELPYEDGEPVPPGYRVVKQNRRGLVIAGSIVGGIAYGFSITGAVSDDFNHKSGFLLVPAFGPWLMLALGGAKNRCGDNLATNHVDYPCDNSTLRSWLVLDGLTQLAGAAMFTFGIAYPTKRLVRKDVTVSMAPISVGKDGYGVGAVGSF
jgi:hypothetical protein